MATRIKPKPTSRRPLLEWSASAAGSPLTVDRGRKVIEGVRVIGRFSRNSHGLKEATGGTEYTRRCMEQALPLYEGAEVLSGHERPGQSRPNGGNDDAVGVLRNARLDGDGDDLCVRADLHYFDSHPITPRLLEDAERGLGVFGLSHDARAGRERFDRASKRLVIESLSSVKSVDLVRKPATNRNLWESSEPMSTTLRKLLESRLAGLPKPRRRLARRMIEDDTAPEMDAPAEAADGGDDTDPDEALWSGFKAAIIAIIDGEGSAQDKAKKIGQYLKAHEKLSDAGGDDSGSDDAAGADDELEEQVGDGSGNQKGQRGAMWANDPNMDNHIERHGLDEEDESEVQVLRRRLAVRKLADDLGVKGDKVLLEAAESLPSLAAARKLLEREAARGGSPRSSGLGGGQGRGGKVPSGTDFTASIKE
jgi:hypothetical protein